MGRSSWRCRSGENVSHARKGGGPWRGEVFFLDYFFRYGEEVSKEEGGVHRIKANPKKAAAICQNLHGINANL